MRARVAPPRSEVMFERNLKISNGDPKGNLHDPKDKSGGRTLRADGDMLVELLCLVGVCLALYYLHHQVKQNCGTGLPYIGFLIDAVFPGKQDPGKTNQTTALPSKATTNATTNSSKKSKRKRRKSSKRKKGSKRSKKRGNAGTGPGRQPETPSGLLSVNTRDGKESFDRNPFDTSVDSTASQKNRDFEESRSGRDGKK